MSDAIVVGGITVEGLHGLGDEKLHPQPFVVDVELRGDLARAARSDSIEATIDYALVAREVRDVVMNESFDLIESIAEAVAARLLALGARSVRVRVAKPKVAKLLDVGEVAVVLERTSAGPSGPP